MKIKAEKKVCSCLSQTTNNRLTVEALFTLVPFGARLAKRRRVRHGNPRGLEGRTEPQDKVLDGFGAILLRHFDHGPPRLLHLTRLLDDISHQLVPLEHVLHVLGIQVLVVQSDQRGQRNLIRLIEDLGGESAAIVPFDERVARFAN